MANYYKYKRSGHNGHYWEFRAYLGLDSDTGKEVRISRRRDGINNQPFKTKREAMDEVARLKAQFIEEGKKKKERRIKGYTFNEVYDEWINNRYKPTVKTSTLAKTQGYFNRYIIPEFGNKKVRNLTIQECDAIVSKWVDSGRLSDYSELVQYVIRVLDYSMYVGYSEENPMEKVYIPARRLKSNKSKKDIEFLDRFELIEFLDECKDYGHDSKWYTFFRLVSYTGCRKSEALALSWSDIDWKNKEIKFNKTLSKISRGADEHNEVVLNDSTKNGRSRTVSIDDKTLYVLNKYRRENMDSRLIFPATNNEDYTHPDLPNTVMERVIKRTGIDKNITPHGLRHTHASLLFEAGLNVKDVQNRLGHSSSSVTMDVYTHISSGRERLAVDVFSDYISGQ